MEISWNGAGYSNSVWAIPADAPNQEAAQELLANVINNKEGQIAFASKIATPVPACVIDVTPEDFPAEVRPFLPIGDNVVNAVLQDTDYYTTNLDTVMDQFNRWVGQ